MTRLRTLVVLFGVVLLGLAAAACVTREPVGSQQVANTTVAADQLSGVTLTIGDQKGGTQATLEASGQLQNLPYKVKWSTFTSGPPQIEAANAGKIDFAITGNTPPIFGAAANSRIKIVTAYSNDASGDQILVPANSPIQSLADLRGKKIAVGKGSSAHGHLLAQLQKVGIDIKDVAVFLQPADAQAAFASGKVDAWAIWDPYTAIAQVELHARTLVTASGTSNGYGFGVASVDALGDARKNTALADLVVRIAKAYHWAADNPAIWAAQYSKIIAINPQAGELANRSVRLPIPLDNQVVSNDQKLADLFHQAGEISTKPDLATFIDPRYNTELNDYFTKS